MGLQPEQGLWSAIAPVGAGDRDVGIGDLAVKALVWSVVRGQAAQASHGLNGVAVGAKWAGVANQLHVLRNQCSVAVDAGPVGHRLWMASAAGDELLFSGQLETNGPASRNGEVGDNVLDQHLLFDAESAANAGLDDPDVLDIPVD